MNNQHIIKVIDFVSFFLCILSVLLLPIFLDKSLVNFYIIPKQYVLGGISLLVILFWSVKMIISRKLTWRISILDKPLLFLLGFGLLASIFSVSIYDSFWGRGEFFVFNFVFLFFSILYYFIIITTVDSRARWHSILNTLVFVGGVTTLIFLIKSIFSPAWLSNLLPIGVWNTIDSSNSVFGFWVVVIFILSAGRIIKKDLSVGSSIFNFLVALISLIGLTFLGFKFLWWVMLVGLVLLLFLGVSFLKEARLWWLSTLFAVLVATAIFIIFGAPKFIRAPIPAEVALGAGPSWNFASRTILSSVKNFIFGSGLGTFGYDFSKFRTVEFNQDQVAWSLRFAQPFNSFFALLSEGGVFFTLTFIFLFLFVLGHTLFVWYKMRLDGMLRSLVLDLDWKKDDLRLEIFLVVIAWILLSVGMVTVYFGPTLWWLWWLLLSLSISGISFINNNIIHTKEWELEDTPQYSLSFSFLMIVLMAGVIMASIWGVRLYSAEVSYAAAIHSKDTKSAERNLISAIEKRDSVDVYHSSLAQVYLLEAGNLSKVSKPDIQRISELTAKAVNEAKRATDISPNSVVIWENLALMYENAAVLVPEARDWAVKSLLKAYELEPSNPILAWRLGNNYLLLDKKEDAIKKYQEAISLKPNYVGAYVSLANFYEQDKQIDQAIEFYKKALTFASNQPELLYNFGRLLYNRNIGSDRTDAEKIWLRAITLEPKYSNALYSLGLLYESKGDKTRALEYYYKVRDLNPDNKDVANKIKALLGTSSEKK